MGSTKLRPVSHTLVLLSLLLGGCWRDKTRVARLPAPPPPTAAESSAPPSGGERTPPSILPNGAEAPPVKPFARSEISSEGQADLGLPEIVGKRDLPAGAIEDAPLKRVDADSAFSRGDDAETASEDELALIDELNTTDIPDNFDLEKAGEQKLGATRSTLPLVLNSQVAKFINYFTGRGKRTYVRTIERAGAYRDMIERILEEEGVPPELFHLAQAESGFRPKARSWAYATGMWQFVKFRGKQYGLRQNRYLDERYDPEKATRAAARHLHDLYIEFGDWYLAMAAYNGGPNRVKTAVKRTGTTDFWTHSRRRFVRRETRNYVPIILAMTYVGKNHDMYGIEIKDPAPPIEYDTVETNTEIHFDLIADITGTNAVTIKQLNPALLRSATPPFDYDLRLPKGSSDSFLSEIKLVPAGERLAWRRHQVLEGDSLAKIAKRYRTKEARIIAHNQLTDKVLPPGMRLTIPAPKRRLSYYGSSGGAGGFLQAGTGRYRIVRGDNLGSISRRFRVSIANLRKWNGLSGNRIIAGRYLIVRSEGVGEKGRATVAKAPPGSGRYRIRRGDTLGTIARRFGVTVAQLKGWNGLTSNRIQTGRTLVVGARGASSSRSASVSAQPTSNRREAAASNGGAGQYKIRRGDNLAIIAQRFGVTVRDLKSWNRLRSSRIRAGKYLTVRPPGEYVPASTSTVASLANPVARGSAATPGERYKIRRGDNLALIARRFDVEVADLKHWNRLNSNRITAGENLLVGPPNAREAVKRASTPRPSRQAASAEERYRIRRGDNLGAIAERFDVQVADLRHRNGLRGNRITAGQYLVIHPGPQAAKSRRSAGAPASPPRRAASPVPADGRYQIRRGDNLGAIAERFGITVTELKRWNGLRGTRITTGDYLNVTPNPAPSRTSSSRATSKDDGNRYRIRKGDTLDTIAKRFGVTVADLKAWNGLRNSRIRAGRYLSVEASGGGS